MGFFAKTPIHKCTYSKHKAKTCIGFGRSGCVKTLPFAKTPRQHATHRKLGRPPTPPTPPICS